MEKTFRLHPQIEINQIENSSDGEPIYMIKSPSYSYLKLGKKEKFLIDRLREYSDLGLSIGASDLACEYFMEYEELAHAYVKSFLYRLWQEGFMKEAYVGIRSRLKHRLKHKLKLKSNNLFKPQAYYFRNIDDLVKMIYDRGGGFFFSSTGILTGILLILLALIFFKGLHLSLGQLFALQGSLVSGMLFIIFVKIVLTSIHELAHALALKHYKRKVLRGGLVFEYGLPSFFVDVNDISMCSRFPRLVVSLAGVISTLYIMALVALVSVFLPYHDFTIKILFVGFFSILINLNPLLKYDGYYVLVDLLNLPLLRSRAFSFAFNKKEYSWPFAFYAFSSIIWTLGTCAFIFYFFGNKFKALSLELWNSHSLMIKFASLGLLFLFVIPILISMGSYLYFETKKVWYQFQKTFWWNSYSARGLGMALFVFVSYVIISQLPSFLLTLILLLLAFNLVFQLRKLWRTIPSDVFAAGSFVFLIIPLIAPSAFFALLYLSYELWQSRGKLLSWVLTYLMTVSLFLVVMNNYTLSLFFLLGFLFVLLEFAKGLLLVTPSRQETRPLKDDRQRIWAVFHKCVEDVFRNRMNNLGPWYLKNDLSIANHNSPYLIYSYKEEKGLTLGYKENILVMNDVRELSRILASEWLMLASFCFTFWGKFQSELQKIQFQKLLHQLYWGDREIFEEFVLKEGHDLKILSGEQDLDFLSGIEMFAGMEIASLKKVMSRLKLVDVGSNETLIHQGEEGHEFFIVYEGMLTISALQVYLGRADVFGERALLLKEKRNASIKTLKASRLLVMGELEFKELLESDANFSLVMKSYLQQHKRFASFLAQVPLFSHLSKSELKLNLLAKKFKFLRMAPGEFVFRQGDVGDNFYIVKDGELELIRDGEVISLMGRGGFFGEMALFSERPRVASVKTLTECIFMLIAGKDFRDLVGDKKLLEQIATRREKERTL